ncbi:MAG: hypothetical protein RLZZ200_435 [Pseudomonadota bacterium]
MPTRTEVDNPCVECGACCAAFRVSFYWAEGSGLPEALLGKVNAHIACMAGTNQPEPHCAALTGDVGSRVSCSIYAQRPSPCREVQPGDERCEKARLRHGLPPLPSRPV